MIKAGEHVVTVGQTGSGKSVMLQNLIRDFVHAPVFILDSKGEDGYLELPLPMETLTIFSDGIEAFANYMKRTPLRKMPHYIVIRPPLIELTEPEILDAYLLEVYLHIKGKCLFVVDELYMIHKSGRCYGGLTAFLTRGRSKGLSLFGATQRPAWVSGFCLSEATYYYVFRLVDIKDRKRLTHLGYPSEKILERFHFYEYDSVTGNAAMRDPLPFDHNQSTGLSSLTNWI